MHYTENFLVVKMKISTGKNLIIFLFLLKGEAVLTSTHNLCFGAKIRKIGIPPHTPVFLYISGVEGGIHFTDMFSWGLLFKTLFNSLTTLLRPQFVK